MKKEMINRMTGIKKKMALVLAAAMLLPMCAVGCQSAQEIAEKRERTEKVTRDVEAYMREKYSRGFKVRKCEEAEGEQYKGDYFISFNNGIHAFYDADEDLFYDDRQADAINEEIMRDIWTPMIAGLGIPYDNINEWSQTFNMVYRYERGGKEYKFSMYHQYYRTSAKYYTAHYPISVTSDNLILVADGYYDIKAIYQKINGTISQFFKNQEKGNLDFYIVSNEYHSRQDFEPENVDETVFGCQGRIHFGEKKYYSTQNYAKVTDGLYCMLCENELVFYGDAVTLVPVEDFDAVSKKITENMDSKDIDLVEKYTAKKRKIDFEGAIYKIEFSDKIPTQNWEDITVAFVMKDTDEPIAEYAEMNEKSHSFFGYDMNGTEYNATCLCSPNSRSTIFHFRLDSEVYFWFGSQS